MFDDIEADSVHYHIGHYGWSSRVARTFPDSRKSPLTHTLSEGPKTHHRIEYNDPQLLFEPISLIVLLYAGEHGPGDPSEPRRFGYY